jgi:putative membrane protein
MRVVYVTVFIILAALIVVFALLNAQAVELNYFLGKRTLPLSLLLLLSLLLGFMIGVLGTLKSVLIARARAHRFKKKATILQKEIDNLRAMPVKDD